MWVWRCAAMVAVALAATGCGRDEEPKVRQKYVLADEAKPSPVAPAVQSVTNVPEQMAQAEAPSPETETRDGTTKPAPPAVPAAPRAAPRAPADVAAFGGDVWKAVRGQPGNVAVSPAGAWVALGLVAAGADGETRDELTKALRIRSEDAKDNDRIASAIAATVREWSPPQEEKDETLTVATAAAVWGKAGVVPADYAKRISSFGEVRPLPSEPDKAAAAVNAWATGQTKGRVTELAEPEDAAGGAVVTSVVYFKGAWWKPFDAAKPGVFHGARGDVTAAPMMSLKDTFGYVEDATLQAAALPYRGTPEYVMLIILPRPGKREAAEKALEGDGLRKLLDAMDVTDKMRKDHEDAVTKILEQESDPADSSAPDSKERGERIFARFQAAGAHVPRRKLTLTLPRFEIQSKFDLVDALRAAGARRVFNGGQAQLGGIAPGMALGRVRQVAWIKVDETGTEGAAATAGGLFGGQFPIPEATMVVDRPFLFAVVAQTARVPLFAGRVEDVKGM